MLNEKKYLENHKDKLVKDKIRVEAGCGQNSELIRHAELVSANNANERE